MDYVDEVEQVGAMPEGAARQESLDDAGHASALPQQRERPLGGTYA
jgi:hypothetical protein